MPALVTALLQGYADGSTSALQLIEQWIRGQGLEPKPASAAALKPREIAEIYCAIGDVREDDDVETD